MTRDFTLLLNAASAGDREAADRLLPLVYEALRELAASKMAQETPRHTLQATALVHEAYLRLVKDEKTRWANRRHFFAAAAEAMRRILIERARRYSRTKHGGDLIQVPFDELRIRLEKPAADLLFLDLALQRLEDIDARQAEVVKLRYFAGFTIAETAETLGISPATVKVDWTHARAWLYQEMVKLDVDSLLGDEE
ncbi:MAG: ECF-type sigma factor [bacterium]